MALALDGTPVTGSQGAGNTAVTGTLTTANGSGNIVVAIASNAASITSVTATGLSFTNRKTITGTSGAAILAEYTAPYTSNFSGTITVTFGTSTVYGQVCAFAISGSPTS